MKTDFTKIILLLMLIMQVLFLPHTNAANNVSPKIVDMPLPWNEEKIRLTEEYAELH